MARKETVLLPQMSKYKGQRESNYNDENNTPVVKDDYGLSYWQGKHIFRGLVVMDSAKWTKQEHGGQKSAKVTGYMEFLKLKVFACVEKTPYFR